MSTMNGQILPIPNPDDWCGLPHAAQLLAVHEQTVRRMIADGVLRGYRPKGSSAVLLWLPQVHQVVEARRIAAGRRPPPRRS